jgi:hypothetical protein
MKDTMSKEERLGAVFRLEIPDRVPVVPLFGYFLCRYSGIASADIWVDAGKRRRAWDRVYRELGEFDAVYVVTTANPLVFSWIMPMKTKWPGKELPPDAVVQTIEEEVMHEDDYAWLVSPGRIPKRLVYPMLLTRMFSRTHPEFPKRLVFLAPVLDAVLLKEVLWLRGWGKQWARRGIPLLWGAVAEAPFDTFSLLRSIGPFTGDLFRRPEVVAEAAMACVDSIVFQLEAMARIVGNNRVWLFLHRSSNSFISPRQFKSLAFPSLREIVSSLAAKGFDLVLHCDGNWDKNLETMLELPAKRCMFQFDGSTDIFRAKEILKGHSCIYGDVPARLLATGSASEVEEYCRNLIAVVGKDGGFCLGSGCELAPDARPENVRAMLHSVKKYGYYG